MKKAQVLSALALAFALGVAVIPTASTYATIQNGAGYDDLVKDFDQAKKDAADLTDCTDDKTVIAANYNTLITTIVNADQYIEDETYSAAAGIVTALTQAAYIADINTVGDALNIQEWKTGVYTATSLDYLKTEDNNTKYNYANVTAYAQGVLNKLNSVIKNNTPSYVAVRTQAQGAADAILKNGATTGALTVASDRITTAENAARDLVNPILNGTFKQDTSSFNTYAKSVAAAKALPFYNKMKTIFDEIKDLQDHIDGTNTEDVISVTTARAMLTALEGNIANFCKTDNSGTGEGTNKPGDDNKDPNAPDTGILADGEANASTTVAMVAGIATALTAAGAGVVAYRNARRSTRK